MPKRLVSIGEAMIEMSGGDPDGESAGGRWHMGFAGDTLNAAWYARAALAENWTVDYVSALGNDRYSAAMRAFMDDNGIGTGAIRTIPDRRPGLYFIHQADGDRHFTYWRDMSAARCLADDPAALAKAIDGAAIVYFSGITLAILTATARRTLFDALKTARAAGATVAFDPNIRAALWPSEDAAREAVSEAGRAATIVLPTFDDEARFFGDTDPHATAARYRALGADEVVVKNGRAPALLSTPAGQAEIAPEPVSAVLDATGAGDSFNGAYLAARAEGADSEAAARSAHATAARCIAHRGALVPFDVLRR
ncbi:sugar kinase [Pararhizobium haloflavum]|uniref:sugar kinase n=1 Tax=Pararhizobium haloflavum TaxID=2037914 RepID=UPI000C17AA66|nr:sugar kinase [Pararhizobium haloflavum]